MKISILFGTETGNAEMLADDLRTALQAAHEVTVANLSQVDPASLSAEPLHLIVCSTYGEGELPSSAQPFVRALETGAHDLSGLRFAIFGLGDEEYEETFGHGSMRLAHALEARGAVQIGERRVHNASGDELPEDVALPWVDEIVAQA